jgi:hypothetical protein
MYSSFVSPQSLSAAKWFNISSICLATIGAGFELFTYLEDYDGTVSLYIRTINQYDKLLNKIEKISHTDVKDRDPSKTERIKNSYVDLQTILDLN